MNRRKFFGSIAALLVAPLVVLERNEYAGLFYASDEILRDTVSLKDLYAHWEFCEDITVDDDGNAYQEIPCDHPKPCGYMHWMKANKG